MDMQIKHRDGKKTAIVTSTAEGKVYVVTTSPAVQSLLTTISAEAGQVTGDAETHLLDERLVLPTLTEIARA
ncbi:hypothetical protein [Microbacterium sp.]|uniref:hypothetical protein n=1 Tax=Microbacterium sp. TaxID=51671 RepID=UPI003F971FF8